MIQHFLMLNTSKSEVIIVGPRELRDKNLQWSNHLKHDHSLEVTTGLDFNTMVHQDTHRQVPIRQPFTLL